MRIMDLRPTLERHFSSRWLEGHNRPKFRSEKPNFLTRFYSRLADRWMANLVQQRNAAPDGPFVLSVGNLALGGTGKTPVIMTLANDLAGRGNRGCILTRGFKSPLSGPLKVDPANVLAGDEARLMASRVLTLGWPVIQSRNRALGLSFILENFEGLDYVLCEDGHQTRKLGRHLDILILDQWQVMAGPDGSRLQPVTGPVFPFGPYRESACGAQRAGIILVETDQEIPALGMDGQMIATFTRQVSLRSVSNLAGDHHITCPYAVLSGIARPGPFERSMTGLIGFEPLLAIRLRDHQEYSPRLIKTIINELDAEGGLPLVTTAKDWVKLEPLWPTDRVVLVAELELEWGQQNALPQLVEERTRFQQAGPS